MNKSKTAGLLDLELLGSLAGLGDDSGTAYLAELYDLFERDARKAIEGMRVFMLQGDALSLAREAHRLKGASGLVGAARLSRGFLAIEDGARSESTGQLEAKIAEAARLLDETVRALQEFVHSPAGNADRPKS